MCFVWLLDVAALAVAVGVAVWGAQHPQNVRKRETATAMSFRLEMRPAILSV